MIDKNMIALAEIRNGYTLNKYGNLTLEQNSLIKYDNLCLKLIEENKKYKEVIEKIQKHIKDVAFYQSPNEFVKVLIEILVDKEVE